MNQEKLQLKHWKQTLKDEYEDELDEHTSEDCVCDGTGVIIIIDSDGSLDDEDNCYCSCHKNNEY